MARVTAPLMSMDASGKFGGALVYSKWKGRNTVRSLVTPKNPKTAKQMGVRAMLGFLAQSWAALGDAAKSSWEAAASSMAVSPFNAYVSANMGRWQNDAGPSQESPATATSAALTISAHAYTGGKGQIDLSLTPSAATNLWGFAIYRDTAEIVSGSWTKCVKLIPADGTNPVHYTDTPLEAGTYHYRACTVQDDGKLGTLLADATAAAT